MLILIQEEEEEEEEEEELLRIQNAPTSYYVWCSLGT